MERKQTIGRPATRPLLWFGAIVFAVVLVLAARSAVSSSAPVHTPVVPTAPPTNHGFLLDRGAERIQQVPRNGGPGGQIGDAPDATSGQ